MDERLGTPNASDVNLVSSIRPRMEAKRLIAVDITESPSVVGDMFARVLESGACRIQLCDQVVLIRDFQPILCARGR